MPRPSSKPARRTLPARSAATAPLSPCSSLGRDGEAAVVAARTAAEGLEPAGVATRSARSPGRRVAYAAARLAVLRSFEERDAFLEDVRVADTVLVLDALAHERGLEPSTVSSELLPG